MVHMHFFHPPSAHRHPIFGPRMPLPIVASVLLRPCLAVLKLFSVLISLLAVVDANADAGPVIPVDSPGIQWVGRFDLGLNPWREIRLKSGQRSNTFKFIQWEGVRAVEVISEASMSLLARPISVNLRLPPVLCWRWRIDATLSKADMSRRGGDDYAGRIYVSFRLPPSPMEMGLRAQLALARAMWGQDVPDAAINYVWDNHHPIGTERPNAYTDRAIMVVQRSGNQQAGRWVEERRNVLEDVSRLFSGDARAVQLAMTADSDNTGEAAHAGFADFHFVPVDVKCDFPPPQP